MSVFLTSEEVQQLTGYKRYSSQVAWLERNGIPHYRAASGRPVVAVAAVEPRSKSAPQTEGDRLLAKLQAEAAADALGARGRKRSGRGA